MALLLLIGTLALPGGGAWAQAPSDSLPAEVSSALERAELPREALVAWVQEVASSGNPTTPRLAWQPDLPVNPASLAKLLTTYAALDLLGPAWTWDTPVWLQGAIDRDGTLAGNLVIKGSGDPKLVLERLWLLFRRLQQFGVQRIRGDIVLDRSAFVVPEQNPADFDGEPLRPYNVAADALLLNYKALLLTFMPDVARGIARVAVDPPLAGVRVDTSVPLAPPGSRSACADWRAALGAQFADPLRIRFTGTFDPACGEKSWSVAYIEPKTYNERALLGLWAEMGGALSGAVREGSAPPTPPSFVLSSPPLADIVRDINKYSNNVMAQQLFLTLALLQRGSGTPENARAVLQQWVADRLGADIAATGLVIDNGSGLSRDTRLSARLLARTLQSAWAAPVMPELIASLPVNGLDGTARRSRSPLVRAHLKTGSLRDVRGIAGYVLGDSGRRYVVVAILNHPDAGRDAARAPLAALLQWVASDGAVAARSAAVVPGASR
ncbi:MAG TPA: D-alanyl-D-alanine carboxypeptidase/D-alanyl-D-alanine-endopeptidase [Burkholderiaceae bacterium]|nr:D-alanyl-D-alanine carboxypeptidase/D-alanyl-D-alanine-endopeptidase [Burkholderiaceae bacterium]